MTNTPISGFPYGTLTANTIIPAVDVDNSVNTNVKYSLETLLQANAGTKLSISGTPETMMSLNPSDFSLSGGVLSVTYPASTGSTISLSGTPETAIALNPSDFSISGGTLSVTYPAGTGTAFSLSGSPQTAIALNPSDFSLSSGTLSVTSGGGASLTLSGTTITAVDPTVFSQTGGTLSLATTAFGSLSAATTLTASTELLVVIGGTAYSATLSQLAAEILTLTQPSITITNLANQYVGNAFSVAGTLSNYSAAPTLTYENNSGSFVALPNGAIVSSTAFSFTHPAPSSTGSLTVAVMDTNGVEAFSNTITVSYATATAATLANVPTTGTAGTAINGVTATLTPSYAQAWAVLTVAGVDQGSRVAFTGTSVPSLTPASTGNFSVTIYAAQTGGTALVTSSAIVVSAITATAATIAGAPGSATGGVAITGLTDTLTPSNATAYVVLNNGTSDLGSRTAFSGTSIPSLTVPVGNAGTYTIKIYDSPTAGNLLATSSSITVTDIVTAATFTGSPTSGTEGVALTGATASLTPSDGTAYAALFVNGAQEGTRYGFSTIFPTLTPASTGTYTIELFAASSGGTALATSAAFPVTILATAATIAGAPSTDTTQNPITGVTATLTPSNATGYAVLNNGTADVGSRVAFTGTAVPALTPTVAGNYTIDIYANATGGSPLATSSSITVSSGVVLPPTIGSGVSAALVLDASVTSSVTSNTALTTPQTTNGGNVLGWKDQSGNGYHFTQTTGTDYPTLATASQNGLNGVHFAQTNNSTGMLCVNTALAQAINNAISIGGSGLTIAMVHEADGSSAGLCEFGAGYNSYSFEIQGGGPQVMMPNGQHNFASRANGQHLCLTVFTVNPSTSTFHVYEGTSSDQGSTSFTPTVAGTPAWNFTQLFTGNSSSTVSANPETMYELDLWFTPASGTGGVSPSGDIATILNYYQTKWN